MENNTESTPAFDAALAAWPGGNLIGAQWRHEERYIAIIDGDADHFMTYAVLDSFATTRSNRWGSPHNVVVAPKFPIELLAWHSSEYGTCVITDTVAALGHIYETMGDQELCDLVIGVFETIDWDHDDDILGHLARVATAARSAGANIRLALELAPDQNTEPEKLLDILRAVH